MKKLMSLFLAALMLLGVFMPSSAYAAGTYKISQDSATVKVGESITLSVTKSGSKVSGVTWASNDISVAKVSSTGKVTGVAAGSTTIVGVVDGTMVECVVSVIKNTTTKTIRYNVLILDNSTSMKGDPFKKEKAAAKRFCKKVLAADGTNYVALIVLTNGSAKVTCKFTKSYDTIAAAIDAKKSATATLSDINEALAQAGTLLKDKKSGTNVMKNIILCSDGLPNACPKLAEGKYKEADNPKHFAYANKTYKTDVALKDKGYFVYALGFFQNSKDKDLSFGKRHMKDLASKDKYYEIDDPDDFEDAFDDITETITSIDINKKKLSMYKGQSKTLTCTYNGKNVTPKWKSSDTGIATVDSTGKVKGVKKGTCTITATYKGKKVTCAVTVKNPSITVDPTTVKIYVGQTKTITATVKGPSQKVTWTSANPKIATVDQNGKVKGIKEGTTTVTAKANGRTAKVTVKVILKHPDYSFYINHKLALTPLGPKKCNEQGAQIVYNKGGKITKCGVYLYKEDGKYYFIVACKGTNLTSVEINNYMGRDGKILYDSNNTPLSGYTWHMNKYSLYKDSDGIWSKGGSFGTVWMNIPDNKGNLLTATKSGVDSEHIKVFKSLDAMKTWLNK